MSTPSDHSDAAPAPLPEASRSAGRGDAKAEHPPAAKAERAAAAKAEHPAAAKAEHPAAAKTERKSERPSVRPGGPQSLIGVVLSGRYLIERLIGEGGMGAVYQAEHTHMRKRLAVKVLHPEMSRMAEVVARFEREAMAAAHIEHPNVAAATDFGKLEDGSFFLVLEYVEGRSLREAIAEGRLDLGRALSIARQMASALGRAHSLGIVHRDLKPENIMLVAREGEAEFVKVLDFGIAKVPVGELGTQPTAPGQALTQLGMVYGTPEYMAPEQALGQAVDPRADLYGLGVILFEMLTGGRPYEHESKVTLLGMHVTAPIPHPSQRAPEALLPPEVDAMVMRLLAKDASDRYPDAKSLIETIDALTLDLVARGRIADLGGPVSVLAHSARASGPRFSGETAVLAATPLASPDLASFPSYSERFASLMRVTREAIERAQRHGPPWIASASAGTLALGAGAAVLAVVLFFVAAGRSGPSHPSSAAPAVPGAAPIAAAAARDTSSDALVNSAASNIEKGDFATAIDTLRSVETATPDRADVHLLLERAYTGVRNAHDAMREAGLLLAADPNGAADLKLQEDVRNAALVKETQEDAIGLLESKMGWRGIDILYDIAYGTTGRLYPQAAVRAKHSLTQDDVRGRASAALSLVLQFRDAKTCDSKHQLLAGARDQGDARLLPTLQQLQQTRGCGFVNASDCYPCLRRDSQLTDAVSAIEDRAAKSP
jgi:serine/threonine protein kinase